MISNSEYNKYLEQIRLQCMGYLDHALIAQSRFKFFMKLPKILWTFGRLGLVTYLLQAGEDSESGGIDGQV